MQALAIAGLSRWGCSATAGRHAAAAAAAAGAERTLYLRGASGERPSSSSSANVPPGAPRSINITGEGLRGQEEAFSLIQFDGASPDLSHIVPALKRL